MQCTNWIMENWIPLVLIHNLTPVTPLHFFLLQLPVQLGCCSKFSSSSSGSQSYSLIMEFFHLAPCNFTQLLDYSRFPTKNLPHPFCQTLIVFSVHLNFQFRFHHRSNCSMRNEAAVACEFRMWWQRETTAWSCYKNPQNKTRSYYVLQTMTAAKGISMDASISPTLSELDTIFTLKEDQKKILEAFLGGKHVFTLAWVFGKSFVSLWQIAAKP